MLLAFPDIPVDSQPGQFDLVLDLATGSYTLDTCDLASHLDIDSVISDMSALPEFIRKYYRLLQGAVSGAIFDMNLPLAGQGLSNSTYIVGQGELIAQALEDEFALGDRSLTVAQAVLAGHGMSLAGPPPTDQFGAGSGTPLNSNTTTRSNSSSTFR